MTRKQSLALFAASIFAQALLVVLYVGRERTFYYWDLGMYHELVRGLLSAPDMKTGVDVFLASFARNYNLLYALPSALMMSVFGQGRVVFILSHFLFFFVPFQILCAALWARVAQADFVKSLPLLSLVCLSVIPLWTPLFEGFPDIAPALCIAAAALVFIRGKTTLREALTMGLFLGLAVILRRHFAYGTIAFFAAAGLDKAVQKTPFKIFLLYFFCAGSAMALSILLAEPAYVQQVLVTDFRELYRSYEEPFVIFARYTGNAFGALTLLLSLTGFALLLRQKAQGSFFLAGFACLWFFLWGWGPSQLGPHHLMPVLPLCAVIGTMAALSSSHTKQRLVFYALAFLLSIQSLWGLLAAPSKIFPNVPDPAGFFAEPHPPLRRNDMESYLALGRYLIQTTTAQDKIVVVGSSPIMNQDILRLVLADFLQRPDVVSRFFWAPEIDNNQGPPVDVYAGGTVFLVPDPVQYHLNPAGQKVVTALAALFPPQGQSAPLFSKDEQTFSLEQNTHLSLWRKKGWTPAAMIDAQQTIRFIAGGSQLWGAVEPAWQPTIQTGPDASTNALLPFDSSRPSATLLFHEKVPEGAYRLALFVLGGPACGLPKFVIRTHSLSGGILSEKEFQPSLLPSPLYQPFSMTGAAGGGAVTLSVSVSSSQQCGVLLQQLRIEKTDQ